MCVQLRDNEDVMRTARPILQSLLRGQTLRGLTPQNNPSNNPATPEGPRKVGQGSAQ